MRPLLSDDKGYPGKDRTAAARNGLRSAIETTGRILSEERAEIDLELTHERYDTLSPETTPNRYLFLCATPRTGSHRLCRAMYEMGLGVPTEYLHPWSFITMGKRWCPNTDPNTPEGFETYWREVCSRRKRNGLVSISVFGYQLPQVRRLIGNNERHIFIHLCRRKRSEQVASLMALYQTKMPYEGETRISGIPDISEISPRSIRVVNQFVELQNKRWRTFLRDKPHLTIITEEFFLNPARVLEEIAVHCGLNPKLLPIADAANATSQGNAYTGGQKAKKRIMAQFPDIFEALN